MNFILSKIVENLYPKEGENETTSLDEERRKRLETAEAISWVIVIGQSPNCKEQKILKKSS